MKITTIIILAIVLTILFGAVPLKILGDVFIWLGDFLKGLGKTLDIFGWGGVLTVG